MYEKRIWEFSFKQFDIPTDDCFFFIHCREPEEIQKFVDREEAKTLLVRRPEVENLEQSNHADQNVFNYNYDFIIENNGDLKDLRIKAMKFVRGNGGKKR